MSAPDDLDALAAEYVIGTLDAGERAAVAARRGREPAIDAAIQAWEGRLAPLMETVVEVAPPDALFPRIVAALAPGARDGGTIDLTRRLRRWRAASLGASALAASLAVAIGLREQARLAQPSTFVAVLQRDATSPAFVMSVDLASRAFSIRPVAAEAPAGHSYELWLVAPALGGPRSLGVVDGGGVRPAALVPYDAATINAATYAVSVEPSGGSPTGAPTGPVVFSGKLVPLNP